MHIHAGFLSADLSGKDDHQKPCDIGGDSQRNRAEHHQTATPGRLEGQETVNDRDAESGDQAAQTLLTDVPVSLELSAQPARVWVASPDWQQGAAIEPDWSYTGGALTLTLPALQYWTMLVIEK